MRISIYGFPGIPGGVNKSYTYVFDGSKRKLVAEVAWAFTPKIKVVHSKIQGAGASHPRGGRVPNPRKLNKINGQFLIFRKMFWSFRKITLKLWFGRRIYDLKS